MSQDNTTKHKKQKDMKKYIAAIHETIEDSFSRNVEVMALNAYEAHKKAFTHLNLKNYEEVNTIEEVLDGGTVVKVYDKEKGFV